MADVHILRRTDSGRRYIVKMVTSEVSHQIDGPLLSLLIAGAQAQNFSVYDDTTRRYLAGTVDQMGY